MAFPSGDEGFLGFVLMVDDRAETFAFGIGLSGRWDSGTSQNIQSQCPQKRNVFDTRRASDTEMGEAHLIFEARRGHLDAGAPTASFLERA